MLIIDDLSEIPALPGPISLSIGNFDGVHLGHKSLLSRLRERAGPNGTSAILSFINHPATVLAGKPAAPAICTLEHKIELLKRAGVDLAIFLTFSKELAKEPFDLFLKQIKKKLPFSFLILGKGAAFGHARQGDETRVKAVEKELDFQAEYLSKEELNGEVVSSGRIRKEIEKGDLALLEKLLNRPYSIYARVGENGAVHCKDLALLPSGSYEVCCKSDQKKIFTTAKIDREHSAIAIDLSSAYHLSSSDPVEIIFKV
ncbi:MAG: FAD synthetase family protein [Chlamydiales bacterium]|nr:FAD synthetase family protein [Chlamydiales bacterium]